jgi:hypothetical protein
MVGTKGWVTERSVSSPTSRAISRAARSAVAHVACLVAAAASSAVSITTRSAVFWFAHCTKHMAAAMMT